MSGNARKKVFGIGAMAVAAIATGGIALNFAPGIATAIAGEAVLITTSPTDFTPNGPVGS